MFYRATSEIHVGSWRIKRARSLSICVDDVIDATQAGAENIQMTSHHTRTDDVRCWRSMQMVRVEERILSTEFKLKVRVCGDLEGLQVSSLCKQFALDFNFEIL